MVWVVFWQQCNPLKGTVLLRTVSSTVYAFVHVQLWTGSQSMTFLEWFSCYVCLHQWGPGFQQKSASFCVFRRVKLLWASVHLPWGKNIYTGSYYRSFELLQSLAIFYLREIFSYAYAFNSSCNYGSECRLLHPFSKAKPFREPLSGKFFGCSLGIANTAASQGSG